MWINMVQPDRPQIIQYNAEEMWFVCRITKARIHSHTLYLIFSAFPRRQSFSNCSSVLRYCTFHVFLVSGGGVCSESIWATVLRACIRMDPWIREVIVGCFWLRIGTGVGHLWVRWGTFGFQKYGEFLDWLQNQSASQEGLCSME